MDKYYVAINSDLASSLMIACQILGWDFEEEINKSLKAFLVCLNDEIYEQQENYNQK